MVCEISIHVQCGECATGWGFIDVIGPVPLRQLCPCKNPAAIPQLFQLKMAEMQRLRIAGCHQQFEVAMQYQRLPLVPVSKHFVKHELLKNTRDVLAFILGRKHVQVQVVVDVIMHVVLHFGLFFVFLSNIMYVSMVPIP